MAQIQEPPSPYAAVYPYNNVTQTESGHFQEWDDTPGAERVRTQHRVGTFVEWHPDGTEVHKIYGNGYRIVLQDDNVIIKGTCNVMIEGNAEVTIQGDSITNIQGNQQTVVEGDYDLLVKGALTVNSSREINLNSPSSLGAIYMQAGTRVVVDSDLAVHGEVLSDSVHAENSISAGCGIHAGVPGSKNPVAGISTLGGVNVGIPGPTAPGIVNATVQVVAPLITGTTMVFGAVLMDPKGGAPAIRSLYNSHKHPSTKPFTGRPLPIMP